MSLQEWRMNDSSEKLQESQTHVYGYEDASVPAGLTRATS